MARPKTKQDLLLSAEAGVQKMWELIDSLGSAAENSTFDFEGKEAHWQRDKNVRDMLIHLYEWQQLLLGWVNTNQQGTPKPFLKEPYTWKTYGEMNIQFWQMHQTTSYANAKKMLEGSHKKIMELIEKFTDEELFTKDVFAWTIGSTLGQYCVSATVAHYDWAITKIKKYQKTLIFK